MGVRRSQLHKKRTSDFFPLSCRFVWSFFCGSEFSVRHAPPLLCAWLRVQQQGSSVCGCVVPQLPHRPLSSSSVDWASSKGCGTTLFAEQSHESVLQAFPRARLLPRRPKEEWSHMSRASKAETRRAVPSTFPFQVESRKRKPPAERLPLPKKSKTKEKKPEVCQGDVDGDSETGKSEDKGPRLP